MAEAVNLAAEPRTVTGKQVRQLRRAGQTPIIVYGRGAPAVALSVSTKELGRVLNQVGGTQLVAIHVAGEPKPLIALAKDVQRHVTRLEPLHADFYEVRMDRLVTVEVPVLVEGESALVSSGEAMLEIVHNTVSVEALPAHLPDAIRIDASKLTDFHDMVRVGDLDLGAEVTILADPDDLLVHLASRAATVAAAEALDAAAEAVIGAGLEAGPGAAAEPESDETDDD